MTARHVDGLTPDAHVRGPRASRVIDGETWAPTLHLDPVGDDLVRAIAGALHDAKIVSLLHVVAVLPIADPGHRQAMLRIREALRARAVLDLPLHPDAAETLSNELWDAYGQGEPPEWCARCGEAYAAVGFIYCAECADGLAILAADQRATGGQ